MRRHRHRAPDPFNHAALAFVIASAFTLAAAALSAWLAWFLSTP
jgi:hypothetical protein